MNKDDNDATNDKRIMIQLMHLNAYNNKYSQVYC